MRTNTEKKIAEIQEYLSDINNTDFIEQINELTEQIELLEQSNKQLEYTLNQIDIILEYNPRLKKEFEFTKNTLYSLETEETFFVSK